MASLHQVVSAPKGEAFIIVGPVTVHRQVAPKTAKNGQLYSTVILKSAGSELTLSLWYEAAKWKLALGETTLRGKFTRDEFNGPCLRCEELQQPDGAVEFPAEEIQGAAVRVSVKEALEAGLRAADYLVRKQRPELAEAAFSFAAQAFLKGVRMK